MATKKQDGGFLKAVPVKTAKIGKPNIIKKGSTKPPTPMPAQKQPKLAPK